MQKVICQIFFEGCSKNWKQWCFQNTENPEQPSTVTFSQPMVWFGGGAICLTNGRQGNLFG